MPFNIAHVVGCNCMETRLHTHCNAHFQNWQLMIISQAPTSEQSDYIAQHMRGRVKEWTGIISLIYLFGLISLGLRLVVGGWWHVVAYDQSQPLQQWESVTAIISTNFASKHTALCATNHTAA
jgi:hypothetical protein